MFQFTHSGCSNAHVWIFQSIHIVDVSSSTYAHIWVMWISTEYIECNIFMINNKRSLEKKQLTTTAIATLIHFHWKLPTYRVHNLHFSIIWHHTTSLFYIGQKFNGQNSASFAHSNSLQTSEHTWLGRACSCTCINTSSLFLVCSLFLVHSLASVSMQMCTMRT